MNNPSPLSVLLVGVAVICSSCGSSEAPPAARHLLLITVDTLRADRLGCYGGREGVSDSIDTLARDGVLFETAYAPAGMTLPSTVSMLTGRYPTETGVNSNGSRLGEEHVTLAERLKRRGFRTRGFVTNGVLKPEQSGLGQGYDEGDLVRCTEAFMNKQSTAFLAEEFGRSGREFLWLHYVAPHAPYDPPKGYRKKFKLDDYRGEIDGSYDSLNPVFKEKIELRKPDLEHVLALYDTEILYIDRLVSKVLEALEKSGAADDTLVIFSSDHGDELYDHHCYFFHANSLYRGVTQVPLMMRLPGKLPAGVRVNGLAELVDVVPTALSLLGVDYKGDPDEWRPRGHDLVPSIDGAPIPRTFSYSQFKDEVYMIRSARWSYLDNPRFKQPRDGADGGVFPIAGRELYDRQVDPYEQYNIAIDEPDVVEKMTEALRRWQDSLVSSAQYLQDLTPERRAELREMGYLGY